MFEGATAWLNSEPLAEADLRGRVVLVDFWTLTCINWLRTVPYIRGWSQVYRDDGLIVVGVHTPEFSFEHDVGLVRQAIAAGGLEYPIAVDNDYAVWRAFDNHYWPALYFLDRDGVVRDQHFGEGRYEQSEQLIQRLLGIERAPASIAGVGIEAEADWEDLRTPETYLGYGRGERFVRDASRDQLALNHWTLDGRWTTGREGARVDEAGASVAFRFHARDAHLVLSNGTSEPIPFRVLLDGAAPGAFHGDDVDEAGNGVLREGRLYGLVRSNGEVRDRTVAVAFDAPGAEAHAFTFG